MNIIENNIAYTDPSMQKHGKNETRTGNRYQRLTDPCVPLLIALWWLQGKMHHEIDHETADIDSRNTLQQPVPQAMGLTTQNIHQI